MELSIFERRVWHEAGHATMALCLNQRVSKIAVYNPDDLSTLAAGSSREFDDGGETGVLYASLEEKSKHRRDVICGGYAAECLLVREGRLQFLSAEDAEKYSKTTCSDDLLRYFQKDHARELPEGAWGKFRAAGALLAGYLLVGRPRKILGLIANEIIHIGGGALTEERIKELLINT
ncbi:hypothetical protein [Dyella mobilis]|uniref:Peptidase M41 domain-containing protein n=1 Tax=Dyella mobilis TaxID=1849582 RepID=A0ABS2KCM0_9GAMM|nr:hypothetical protein [Dyella mobilis]MBM7128912.1 hypothetical protein [Dyella mobilis]